MENTATQRTALLAVCLSAFIGPLMLSAVNVAIPAIARGLHVDAILMSWVPTAYLLTSAVLLLPFGKIADIYGRKKVFLTGMSIVTIASVCASTSPSIGILIAWRVLQGIGASMLFSTGVAILSSVFPREKRGAAIGMSVSSVYFGLTCGPLVGGWATQHFSWRAAFLVHVPLAVAVIAFVAWRLRQEWRDERAKGFDLPGAMIYAVAIVALMYGFSILPSHSSAALILFGLAGIAAFVRFESRIENPIFDTRLFLNNRVFTFSCLASLVVYSSTFANSYLMSLYLQYLQGMTPRTAGMIMMSQPLIMALCSPFAGRLSDRAEPRFIASLGITVIALGLGLLSTLSAGTPVPVIVGYLFTVGLGVSLFSSPNVNAIMGSVAKEHLGTASGASGTMRVLGQMFSMAIVTVVFAFAMGRVHIDANHLPQLLHSIRMSFLVAACVCGSAILLSLSRGTLHR